MTAPAADDYAAVIEEAQAILDDLFQPVPGCCQDCDDVLTYQEASR